MKRAGLKLSIILPFLFILGSFFFTTAYACWEIKVVDSYRIPGTYNSITAPDKDTIFISYSSSGGLKFARWTLYIDCGLRIYDGIETVPIACACGDPLPPLKNKKGKACWHQSLFLVSCYLRSGFGRPN